MTVATRFVLSLSPKLSRLIRGRLLVVSPAPQPFWPCPGRNSTYAVVQIRHLSA